MEDFSQTIDILAGMRMIRTGRERVRMEQYHPCVYLFDEIMKRGEGESRSIGQSTKISLGEREREREGKCAC